MNTAVVENRRPLIAAGTLLGIGLGGFVDGIVFHQLLQFHNMLSGAGYYPKTGLPPDMIIVNMQINMFWDRVFHSLTWCMTVGGVAMLWLVGKRSDVPWSTPILVGGLFLGWGLFNLVEGIIDHHILHLHHVTETQDHLTWDITFLIAGAAFIVFGLLLIASARNDETVREPRLLHDGK